MSTSSVGSGDNLSSQQQLILEGFIADNEPRSSQQLATADQASVDMRMRITDGFSLELTSIKEYYDVMAGIAIATTLMEQLIEVGGLAPETAGKFIRMSLGPLVPRS